MFVFKKNVTFLVIFFLKLSHNKRFLRKNHAKSKLANIEKNNMKSDAIGLVFRGSGTFIPKKLATKVGTEISIVISESRCIIIPKLLEMMEECVSIVLLKMLV